MASSVPALSPGPLHIVVTCTNRKRQPVPARLRLGDLREWRPGPRFTAWTRRLAASDTATYPAVDLYAGEHWQHARALPAITSSRPTVLWVCSAGYGLLPAETAIRPYAATFAPGEADSVGATVTQVRDWWTRLTEWADPAPHQPRSFTDLARRNPEAAIVAVLSEPYQRACADDLNAAAAYLRDAEQIAVMGASRSCPELSDLLVPFTARLQGLVGGSLLSLNVRVAAHLIRGAGGAELRRSLLRKLALEATNHAPPVADSRPPGQRLTDDDVRAFIRAQLAAMPGSATTFLRLLRQSGMSCEQKRFGQLFAEVTMAGRNG